jgi:hypothetical protein
MNSWADETKKKRCIGLGITALSFTAAAASAYRGYSYSFSAVFGICVGLISGVAYNVFAKASKRWPVVNFFDLLSQIFVW